MAKKKKSLFKKILLSLLLLLILVLPTGIVGAFTGAIEKLKSRGREFLT